MRAWIVALAPVTAAAALLAVMLHYSPYLLRTPLRQEANIVLGRSPGYAYRIVRVGGRDFSLDPSVVPAVQRILDRAERQRRAGARTLFVGTHDLRRTALNDAYLYYLLDDLKPSSRYMELNPLVASRAGSGLASDIARSDLLILSSAYDTWNEPNASRRYESNVPNEIVKRRFCLLVNAPPLELVRRCR
jgi:hypothetical protein